MSRILLVVVASAALQTVGAQPVGNFSAGDFVDRIDGNVHKVGDSCHPLGAYRLGDGNVLAPPCIAEQASSSYCEKATGVGGAQTEEQRKAYRDCLFGPLSTFSSDQKGCLKCKVANKFLTQQQADFFGAAFDKGNAEFKNDLAASGLWNTVQKHLDWAAYDKLPKFQESDRKDIKVPVEEYFKDAVKPQRFGEYTLNGTTDKGPTDALPPVLEDPIENRDPMGQEIEAIVPGANSTAEFSTVLLYQAQINFFHFKSGGEFTFGCIKEELIRISNVRVKPATQEEIKSLPNADNCTSCKKKSASRENIDKAAAGPATAASEETKFVLDKIESETKASDKSGQIDPAAQDKIGEAVAEKFGETTSGIPDVKVDPVGTAEKTKSNSTTTYCKRKRSAA
ncbi:hypothetical protein MY11210_008954 [Beauveria gryllotalpidicola]